MKTPINKSLIFLAASFFVFSVTALSQTFQASVAKGAPSVTDTLALVNGQSIALGDLDPRAQEMALKLNDEIAKLRRQMLEDQINQYIYESEAKLRRMTAQQYLSSQVGAKIGTPTEKEIQGVYEANRDALANTDETAARKQIVAYLRNEKGQKLLNDLSQRLRKTHKVVMGEDVNSQNLTQNATLATVDGRTITASFLEERMKPVIYDLRIEAYDAQKKSLDNVIYSRLILDEARKQSVGPEEIVRKEVTEKFHYPTEEEVKKFYEDNKARLVGVAYDAARAEISRYLEQQEQERLEKALNDKLRSSATIQIFLTEPEPPVQNISTANAPSRGNVNAAVTVVMFTDFQCPACSATHPVLQGILKQYGDNVRFVVRDFPLDELHPQARKAAEAAEAAHAQGKFFEYIELLYQNQKALDIASLKKYASQVGLNRVKFDADLTSGKYAMYVQHDYEEGILYGIKSTPTIFVNGVRVRDLRAETLQNAIDRAFKQKGSNATNKTN